MNKRWQNLHIQSSITFEETVDGVVANTLQQALHCNWITKTEFDFMHVPYPIPPVL